MHLVTHRCPGTFQAILIGTFRTVLLRLIFFAPHVHHVIDNVVAINVVNWYHCDRERS
jgi:hypothetical protein